MSPSLEREPGIDEVLARRRIIVTCGTGGVGKTTVSAAMALRAAMLGKRAVVITIDPAKRLATSLGMKELGDRATDLTPRLHEAADRLRARGETRVPARVTGSFAAIMPDTRRTFEDFVHSLAPRPEIAERVIRNPIFQIFAKEFSGSNEYMALQRLHALDRLREYDCIILDTPPSRNTLAFLDAPQLLAQFFDERVIKWLVLPANKLVAAGMKKAFGILESLTGKGFMTHLFDFAQSIFEVRVGFVARLKEITALLESQAVGFFLVAAPTPDTEEEIGHFVRSVESHRFHFDGVAINRTLGYLRGKDDDEARAASAPADAPGLGLLEALQKREDEAVRELLGAGGKLPLFARLPELARDVHSMEDLLEIALLLGAETGDERAAREASNAR